jgi:hypothetical protein
VINLSFWKNAVENRTRSKPELAHVRFCRLLPDGPDPNALHPNRRQFATRLADFYRNFNIVKVINARNAPLHAHIVVGV